METKFPKHISLVANIHEKMLQRPEENWLLFQVSLEAGSFSPVAS